MAGLALDDAATIRHIAVDPSLQRGGVGRLMITAVLEELGYWHESRIVRKAIRMRTGVYGDGEWQLYDIKSDPGETRPLEAEQPERLRDMIAIFERYAEEKGIVPVAEDWSPWSQL